MTVRWSRDELARRRPDRLPGGTVDELDGVGLLVLDDVTDVDDPQLGWIRRAPCVVASVGDGPPPTTVDLALAADDHERLDAVEETVAHAPQAAAALADVLRTTEQLSIVDGLRVESFAYSMLLASPEFRRWLDARSPGRARTWTGPPVRMARSGTELLVTLARPENRNAFSAALRDGLLEALAVAEADPSLERVVVDADGPVFSSGGDLDEFGTADDVARAHRIRTLRSVGAALHHLGPRVEVRVQGACVGAGVELPAFAARVVAQPDATFRLPEVAMGLVPGAGGTVSLTHRIGRQRTAELALTGRAMAADEALAVGLVDEIVRRPGTRPADGPGPPRGSR